MNQNLSKAKKRIGNERQTERKVDSQPRQEGKVCCTLQSVSVEMQSVEVKSEEMQPQPKPEMQFKSEMQSEMQPKPPALKPKRFALKSRKRSALKPIQQKLSFSDMKPLRLKRSASETMVSELKRCKSAPPKPITLEDLPVMIQMNGQKYAKLMKHQDQVVVNVREYITDLSSGKLHPTKKGIILSLKDWQSLKKEMKTVTQLLQQLTI